MGGFDTQYEGFTYRNFDALILKDTFHDFVVLQCFKQIARNGRTADIVDDPTILNSNGKGITRFPSVTCRFKIGDVQFKVLIFGKALFNVQTNNWKVFLPRC